MRRLVRVAAVALVLSSCHAPQEPPPVAPKPIDPLNMRGMSVVGRTASLEPHPAGVIDASIVSAVGGGIDAWAFELDVGVRRCSVR